MAKLTIKIDKKTGQMIVEADGFKGPVCEEVINKIFSKLEHENKIKKPEYDDKVEIKGEVEK